VVKTLNTTSIITKESLIATSDWDPVKFTQTSDGKTTTLVTGTMKVEISESSGDVAFLDLDGKILLEEAGPAVFTDGGVEQTWSPIEGESLFGGGEYQNGLLNYAKTTIQMIQFNTEAIVPYFVSSTGYGLLWDAYSGGYLNPPKAQNKIEFEILPGAPVVEGSKAILSPCLPGADNQAWSMSGSSIELKSNSSLVLDMDYPTYDVHAWTKQSGDLPNQQWTMVTSTVNTTKGPKVRNQIKSTAHGGCLAAVRPTVGSALRVLKCDLKDGRQLWSLNATTGNIKILKHWLSIDEESPMLERA